MTPTAAEQVAENLLEAERKKNIKEAGKVDDPFATFLQEDYNKMANSANIVNKRGFDKRDKTKERNETKYKRKKR